jgi:phosphoenolpyruvate carboxylase
MRTSILRSNRRRSGNEPTAVAMKYMNEALMERIIALEEKLKNLLSVVEEKLTKDPEEVE